jgi:LacI family transcriptional regulator
VGRLTIKDVAKAAGVHPGTASRALNPRLAGRISAETTRRVVQAAAELGYVTDVVGRSLRTRRSATIGVLVPDLLNPFYPPLLRGVETGLRREGFEALIASTDNEPDRESAIVAGFKARQCDGYIIASATHDDPTVNSIVADGLPVVLVSRLSRTIVPSVVSDDARGISQAVRHLRELDHRRIAHITGPVQLSVTETRENAFRAAVPDGIVVRAESYTAAAGEQACAILLDSADVTAILAGNDMIAAGCYAAFDRRGLSCPADISLVGINNMPLAEWLRPGLTTVAIPQEDLGAQAARLIITLIDDPAADVGSVTLPTELVVRGSTARARRATRPSA